MVQPLQQYNRVCEGKIYMYGYKVQTKTVSSGAEGFKLPGFSWFLPLE